MADQAKSSITINAPKSQVMAVIADFTSYPQWSDQIKSVKVDDAGSGDRAKQVTFTLDAGVIKDDYTLAYTWTGDERVDWTLVKSKVLKSQDGSYILEDAGNGTEVTYKLTVDLNIPMLAMLKRRAEKMIIDTALKGLKKRVESL